MAEAWRDVEAHEFLQIGLAIAFLEALVIFDTVIGRHCHVDGAMHHQELAAMLLESRDIIAGAVDDARNLFQPSRVAALIEGQGSARMLLFFNFRGRVQAVESDYRKFKATSTILPGMSTVEPSAEPK